MRFEGVEGGAWGILRGCAEWGLLVVRLFVGGGVFVGGRGREGDVGWEIEVFIEVGAGIVFIVVGRGLGGDGDVRADAFD